MKYKYDDFDEAFAAFVRQNVITATEDWHDQTYVDCEIRIKVNANGGGYIHLLNRDSDTIEFRSVDSQLKFREKPMKKKK